MRIVKPGTPPPQELFHARCRQCKAIIEFDRKEALSNDLYDLFVECPTCRTSIPIAMWNQGPYTEPPQWGKTGSHGIPDGHLCGLHCDGQDGMTSQCFKERQRAYELRRCADPKCPYCGGSGEYESPHNGDIEPCGCVDARRTGKR